MKTHNIREVQVSLVLRDTRSMQDKAIKDLRRRLLFYSIILSVRFTHTFTQNLTYFVSPTLTHRFTNSSPVLFTYSCFFHSKAHSPRTFVFHSSIAWTSTSVFTLISCKCWINHKYINQLYQISFSFFREQMPIRF